VSGDGYFTGDEKSLFEYWQDEERAQKFLDGGTRTDMVKYVLKKDTHLLEQSNWLDIGGGAGFIQSNVGIDLYRMAVVLDISLEGLRIHICKESQRINGSFKSPPFRRDAFDTISSFFCLSDYPELGEILTSFVRMANGGHFILVDYGKGDEYWENRKKAQSPSLIGNINLRSAEYISQYAYKHKNLEAQESEDKEIIVEAKKLKNRLHSLPAIIKRVFFHAIIRMKQNS